MTKVFDRITILYLLVYRLLQYNIDGRMYEAVLNILKLFKMYIKILNHVQEPTKCYQNGLQYDMCSKTLAESGGRAGGPK